MRRLFGAWLLGSAAVAFVFQALCGFTDVRPTGTRSYCAVSQPEGLIVALLVGVASWRFLIRAPSHLDSLPFQLPSRARRMAVIAGYAVAILALYFVALDVIVSDACFIQDRCSRRDDIVGLLWTLSLLIALPGVVALGWKGRLFGCRRHVFKIDSGAA